MAPLCATLSGIPALKIREGCILHFPTLIKGIAKVNGLHVGPGLGVFCCVSISPQIV